MAKHGNNAVSSQSGSAEFFRQLGVPLNVTAADAQALLSMHNFCFFFAPNYHRALRFASSARKSLGVKTIMNVLGPLVNPVSVTHQLIGVFDKELLVPVARAAHQLGISEVAVVHGHDGQDEVSIHTLTSVVRMHADGTLQQYTIDPTHYGFAQYALTDLVGGNASTNAQLALDLVAGKGRPAIRDAVILNSAVALSLCYPKISIKSAIPQCYNALSSGAVAQTLQGIAAYSTDSPA